MGEIPRAIPAKTLVVRLATAVVEQMANQAGGARTSMFISNNC